MTCWEVFSGGKTPYPGIHPLELSRQLEMGYRMENPLNAACPEEMYAHISSEFVVPSMSKIFSRLPRQLLGTSQSVQIRKDSVISGVDLYCSVDSLQSGHSRDQ